MPIAVSYQQITTKFSLHPIKILPSRQVMSLSLDAIKKPIEKELTAFEVMFKQSMKTRVPLLDTIMTYIVKRKGKQIRPLFVMYSAKLFGDINIRTYRGASLVELLHTATLVHDDVVDDSFQRRGFFSINALWKNKIAVLVGDYLLSRGLLLAVEHRDFDMCCEIGAASTTPDTEIQKKMRQFGEAIGLAFQIRDDLFDFGDNKSGKPAGLDIKEKKLTLPIIYAFSKASPSDVKKIKKLMRSDVNDKQKIADVVEFITVHGGMSYARIKMNEFRDRAFEILESIPANKEHKQTLQHLVNFVIDRNV